MIEIQQIDAIDPSRTSGGVSATSAAWEHADSLCSSRDICLCFALAVTGHHRKTRLAAAR